MGIKRQSDYLPALKSDLIYSAKKQTIYHFSCDDENDWRAGQNMATGKLLQDANPAEVENYHNLAKNTKLKNYFVKKDWFQWFTLGKPPMCQWRKEMWTRWQINDIWFIILWFVFKRLGVILEILCVWGKHKVNKHYQNGLQQWSVYCRQSRP